MINVCFVGKPAPIAKDMLVPGAVFEHDSGVLNCIVGDYRSLIFAPDGNYRGLCGGQERAALVEDYTSNRLRHRPDLCVRVVPVDAPEATDKDGNTFENLHAKCDIVERQRVSFSRWTVNLKEDNEWLRGELSQLQDIADDALREKYAQRKALKGIIQLLKEVMEG